MEIQAKLSFKHGRIVRALKLADITVKELSVRCGWNYQKLLGFVKFQCPPDDKKLTALLEALQNIDSSITEEEIFPKMYDQVKEALRTRVSTKDIPLENLVSCNPDTFAIEDHTEETVDLKIDIEKMLSEMKEVIPGRSILILKMYYGIGYVNPKSLKEIGEEFNLSANRIQQIKENSLKILSRNFKMKETSLYI